VISALIKFELPMTKLGSADLMSALEQNKKLHLSLGSQRGCLTLGLKLGVRDGQEMEGRHMVTSDQLHLENQPDQLARLLIVRPLAENLQVMDGVGTSMRTARRVLEEQISGQ